MNINENNPDYHAELASIAHESAFNESQKIPAPIVAKALKALEQWAWTFKLIGNNGDETPRYAQLLSHTNDRFTLHSTQRMLYYELELTEEEELFLQNMDSNVRWIEWREIRNEYLRTNHSTIKL